MATKSFGLPKSELNTIYDRFKKYYLNMYNKKGYKESAKQIRDAYNYGIKSNSNDTLNGLIEAAQKANIKGATKIPSGTQVTAALNELRGSAKDYAIRKKNLETVSNTFKSLDEYLKTNSGSKFELPTTIMSSISRFDELLTTGTTVSKRRGTLGLYDNFNGSVSNIIGSLTEVSAAYEIDSILSSKNLFKNANLKMTGSNKQDIRVNKDLTLKGVTDARDISIDIGEGSTKLTLGISVKQYKIDTKTGTVNMKIRDSTFNTVLKYLQTGGSEALKLSGILSDRLTREKLFSVGFHEYKSSGAMRSSQVYTSEYNNIDDIINTTQVISGMILLDSLIGQGDFNKLGLQMLLVNGTMLDFSYLFPENLPRADGISPTRLLEVAPLGKGSPSYYTARHAESASTYYQYLTRYSSLNLVLREKINMNAALSKMKA